MTWWGIIERFGVCVVCCFVLFFTVFIGVGLSKELVFGPMKQAKILNAEFGTNYTYSDMLFAGGTIEQIIEGSKHRVVLTDAPETP